MQPAHSMITKRDFIFAAVAFVRSVDIIFVDMYHIHMYMYIMYMLFLIM